jgi:hypothetical protein
LKSNRFTNSRFTWTGDGEPEQVLGFSVSSTFFETLGVRPLLGRTFTAGEDEPGRPRTVVVSERLWRRKYYGLTTEGRKQLRAGERSWARFAEAVFKVFAARQRA